MSNENENIQKIPQRGNQPGRPKNVKVVGGKKITPGTPEILGGGSAKTTGPLKTLDNRSPVEDQIVEVNVHDDEKSFKEEIET